MRPIMLVLVVSLVAAAPAGAYETRTTIGDVPRTYTHFMNAREAAFCRANSATGDLSAYFFNPAVATEIREISGHATVRLNSKTREYLSETLDPSDDVVLFSQAIATKRSGLLVYGFGYSCPAYRNLEIGGTLDGHNYVGEFNGGLRFFEAVFGTRIGQNGEGGLGIAAGVASIDDYAREVSGPLQDRAEGQVDGMAASLAIGFTFDPTDRLRLGVGYRFSTEFDVEGEGDYYQQPKSGTAKTQPVAVGGLSFRVTDNYTVHASYVQEGWESAEASVAPYDTDCVEGDCGEGEGRRNEFEDSLGTAALGVEGWFADGRFAVRAGFSKQFAADIDNEAEPEYRELVPEYAAGLGGSVAFEQYVVDLAVVREEFADGDDSGQVVNHGVYVTVGYEF